MGQKTGMSKKGNRVMTIEMATARVAACLHHHYQLPRYLPRATPNAPEVELGQTTDEWAELAILHIAVRPSIPPSNPRRATRRQPRRALLDVVLRNVGREGRVEFGLEEGEEEVEEVDPAFLSRERGQREERDERTRGRSRRCSMLVPRGSG